MVTMSRGANPDIRRWDQGTSIVDDTRKLAEELIEVAERGHSEHERRDFRRRYPSRHAAINRRVAEFCTPDDGDVWQTEMADIQNALNQLQDCVTDLLGSPDKVKDRTQGAVKTFADAMEVMFGLYDEASERAARNESDQSEGGVGVPPGWVLLPPGNEELLRDLAKTLDHVLYLARADNEQTLTSDERAALILLLETVLAQLKGPPLLEPRIWKMTRDRLAGAVNNTVENSLSAAAIMALSNVDRLLPLLQGAWEAIR